MPRHVSDRWIGLGRGPRDCARTVARKAKLCRTLICGRRLSRKWPALWNASKSAELDYLLPILIANENFLLICNSSTQQTTRNVVCQRTSVPGLFVLKRFPDPSQITPKQITSFSPHNSRFVIKFQKYYKTYNFSQFLFFLINLAKNFCKISEMW